MIDFIINLIAKIADFFITFWVDNVIGYSGLTACPSDGGIIQKRSRLFIKRKGSKSRWNNFS